MTTMETKILHERWRGARGRKPCMLRHYFKDSQFEIPTQATWEAVYMPLGFGASYEELRNTHNVDAEHCNIWHVPPLATTGRLHTCQKPTEILERLIRVSSKRAALYWIHLWAPAPPPWRPCTWGGTT